MTKSETISPWKIWKNLMHACAETEDNAAKEQCRQSKPNQTHEKLEHMNKQFLGPLTPESKG